MSAKADLEARLLKANELDIVNATRHPNIKQLPVEELKIIVQRLRKAHARSKDIGAQQKREMRGKADPRGAKRTQDNTGTLLKAQMLREAIERVRAELGCRKNPKNAAPRQAELSRHALELKLSHQAPTHPDPGRTASEGMKNKERQKPLEIGTSKKEVGRVSQAGKVAQARRDSRGAK